MPGLSFFKISILSILLGVLSSCLLMPEKGIQAVRCDVFDDQYQAPKLLSQTCLYDDIESYRVSSYLRKFTPNFQLWSDGAYKSRWIYLPPNTRVNSDNPDQWIFPVGTQFFKEFTKKITLVSGIEQEIKVETRHLIKTQDGEGVDAWSLVSYAWRRINKKPC